MNNLTRRIITSVIGASIMIGAILWSEISLLLILLLLSIAVHVEYLLIVQNFKGGKKNYTEWAWSIITGIVIFIYTLQFDVSHGIRPDIHFSFDVDYLSKIGIFTDFAIFVFFFFGFVVIELFDKKNNPFQSVGLNIIGLLYCVFPFALLDFAAIRVDFEYMADMFDFSVSSSPINTVNIMSSFVLGYFLIIWSNDIFAYMSGRLFGKHKLFERISPNKTWEGFFGGMIAAIACAFVLSLYFDFLSRTNWIIMGFIISIFGTLGDLVESMLKRSVQIKDSSSILPGHGGFLDRFDGTLLAAPAVFVWLMLAL